MARREKRQTDVWRRGAAMAALVLGLALIPGQGLPARASDRPLRLAELGATTAPIGWRQFCQDFADDCRARPARVEDVALTRAVWGRLVGINAHVNASIEPVTDLDQYGREEVWTYPVSGKGDCEDYVLLKKQLLIRAGLPAAALLITVVRDLKGEGHAILTVRTDRGDYVLDNETDEIRLWHQTGYQFIKRQSPADPNRWVSLGPAAAPAAVASRQETR